MQTPTAGSHTGSAGGEPDDAAPERHLPSMPRDVRLSHVVVLLGLPPAAATLLASAGGVHWTIDLVAHFPLPSLLALAPAALLLFAAKRAVWAALFAVCALLCTVRLWPLWFSPPLAVAGADATPLRVVAANVCFENARAADLLPLLRERGADVVAVCEVTERVRRQLEPLLEHWPHNVVDTHEDCYGVALYSRLPLSQTEVLSLGTHRAPAIRAVVETDAGPVGILCVHPPRPGGDNRSNERDRAFQEMESALAPLPPRRIVLGDTNATRWSVPFATALARNGLRDSSEGHGYQGSWPAGLPGFLRLPIDHVLVTDGIGVPQRALLVVPGSDHLAVFAELLLPRAGNGR